jgi:hypothetical protein
MSKGLLRIKMSIKSLIIRKIPNELAQKVVVENHYLHRKAPCSFAFGLFDPSQKENNQLFSEAKLMGVIMYGTPSSSSLREGICGKEEKDNVIELTRLWISDEVGKNGESYLIGNTIPMVGKEIIVSYAEIQQGHSGIVYQATNWLYTGLSAKRTNWNIKGNKSHSQTLADRYTSKELKEILGDSFTYVERPRKHRYVYFNCNKYRKKELISKLNYPLLPYPKPILNP